MTNRRIIGLAGHPLVEIESERIYTEFTGSREALIAGGFATEAMFPEGRKRTKRLLGPGGSWDLKFDTKYLKGGRWTVRRWHEAKEAPRRPIPWDPEKYRAGLLVGARAALQIFVVDIANGESEHKAYGQSTHQLNDTDQQKVAALAEQIVEVIRHAVIERGISKPNVFQLSLTK